MMLFFISISLLFCGNFIHFGQSQGLSYQSAKLIESVNFDDIKCPSDCKAGYRFDIGWIGDQGWLTTTGGVNILCPNCVWYHTPTLDYPMNTPTGGAGRGAKPTFGHVGKNYVFLQKTPAQMDFGYPDFHYFPSKITPLEMLTPLETISKYSLLSSGIQDDDDDSRYNDDIIGNESYYEEYSDGDDKDPWKDIPSPYHWNAAISKSFHGLIPGKQYFVSFWQQQRDQGDLKSLTVSLGEEKVYRGIPTWEAQHINTTSVIAKDTTLTLKFEATSDHMDYRSVWLDDIMLFEITPDENYVSPLPPHWPSQHVPDNMMVNNWYQMGWKWADSIIKKTQAQGLVFTQTPQTTLPSRDNKDHTQSATTTTVTTGTIRGTSSFRTMSTSSYTFLHNYNNNNNNNHNDNNNNHINSNVVTVSPQDTMEKTTVINTSTIDPIITCITILLLVTLSLILYFIFSYIK